LNNTPFSTTRETAFFLDIAIHPTPIFRYFYHDTIFNIAHIPGPQADSGIFIIKTAIENGGTKKQKEGS
jgi:hypothetical protein